MAPNSWALSSGNVVNVQSETPKLVVFALAGLWDEWKSPDGEVIESCAILTTTPNSLVADMHDRMPMIVTPDRYEVWLDPDVTDFGAIRDILKPYDAQQTRRYPVSTKLNNSRNEGAESAAPVTLDDRQRAALLGIVPPK